jgi:hypothetical protein
MRGLCVFWRIACVVDTFSAFLLPLEKAACNMGGRKHEGAMVECSKMKLIKEKKVMTRNNQMYCCLYS